MPLEYPPGPSRIRPGTGGRIGIWPARWKVKERRRKAPNGTERKDGGEGKAVKGQERQGKVKERQW